MAAKNTPKVAPEFARVREFIKRYCVLPTDHDYDIATIWAMGTWTFSPACPANPVTYPYLYLTGAKGSGKTLLGQDVFSYITRNHRGIAMATGPALFRLIGTYDDESGEIVSHFPTLAIDEVDAAYSGNKDEALRGVINVGYKRGMTIPRAAGKGTIDFPVYCPKVLMGIDNGHLPDTITDRSIRIDITRATPEQMSTIEELYSFDVEEEAAELSQMLSDWAKREAMVLRDYRPAKVDGLSPRQWEIARSLVQLAHALNMEDRIRTALHSIMTRNPERPDGKVALYQSIFALFNELDQDRLTSRQLLNRLTADGIRVPGNSMKGLSAVLSADGIMPKYIRLKDGHPGITTEDDGKVNYVHRGYMRFSFDDAFVEYLQDDE